MGVEARGVLLQVVPALIGAFVGAPVLARELETGTFRYAWTQGFGRWRWALAKLVAARGRAGRRRRRVRRPGVLVLPAVLRTGNQALGLHETTPLATAVQPARGRVPRLDAGRLRDRRPGRHAHPPGRPRDRRHPGRLRRARLRDRGVPARALPDTAGPTSNSNVPGTAWIISQWWTKDGRFAFAGNPPINLLNQFCSSPSQRGRAGGPAHGTSRSASPRTATRSGPATSRPAGSGRSSGSRAAGCSRCQRCSSPRPSGWSTAAPPDPLIPAVSPSGRNGTRAAPPHPPRP